MTRLVSFALWAGLLALSAEASLDPYSAKLELPPMCQACKTYIGEVLEIEEPSDKDTRLRQVCNGFPAAIKNQQGWEETCMNADLIDGSLSPQDWCATNRFCPTHCHYCETRAVTVDPVYYAWSPDVTDLIDNGKDYCAKVGYEFGADINYCDSKIEEFRQGFSDNTDSVADQIVAFCHNGPFGCASTGGPQIANWAHALQNCIDEPITLECGNGKPSRNTKTLCSIDHVCFDNPCDYEDYCVCDINYALDSDGLCTVSEARPQNVPNEARGEDEDEDGGSFVNLRAHVYNRKRRAATTEEALRTQIALSMALVKQQSEENVFDCSGQEWTYFTDSPVDGVTYSSVGQWSSHEHYAMAIKQDLETISIAFNHNLAAEGQMMNANVTVSMGDFIMNPMNADGVFPILPVANEDDTLWGIHHDATNDNPDALGVYNKAKAISVANTNNGFNSVSEYIAEVDHLSSYGSPTAALLHFGGGIDEEGERGIGYLGETPLNLLKPGHSTFLAGLSEMNYYWIEDPTKYPEDAEALERLKLTGIDWATAGGTGFHTRIFSVPRSVFPDEGITFRVQQASECFNDVIAAVVEICAIPSVTPSVSRTPSRTNTRTPTNSPSRSPSSTASVTRSASGTPSSTSAPSFPAFEDDGSCMCFDYGDSDSWGINTVSLGHFNGASDTQGRLFVCGDANLKSYSISDGLPDDNRVDLFVKGTLDWPSGRIIGGNIKYGEDAKVGQSVVHSMANHTLTQDGSYFDCDGADIFYQMYSDNIGKQVATGQVSFEDDGAVFLKRGGTSTIEFFDLNCTDLSKINRMAFKGVPDGQTVVINWRGKDCKMTGLVIESVKAEMIVFNFPEAENLYFSAALAEANFLAPFANFTGNGGVIKGQIVVGNWDGSTQQNYGKCLACLQELNPLAIAAVGF